MTKISHGVAIAAIMIAAALAAAWGVNAGLLDKDASVRTLMIANALLLAYYGNAVPKIIIRTPGARQSRRFVGWVFVFSGLLSAALWLLAPLDVATPASLIIIGGAVVLAVSWCYLSPTPTAKSE